MNRILNLPKFILSGISYHLAGSVYTPLPRLVMFVVTRRCNSRCIMCQSWQDHSKDEELTITEIKRIFSDPFFRKVENVIISGGEPTLRDDLPEIISAIQQSCPRLRHIWASSNGFNPKLLEKRVMDILDSMEKEKINQLTFNISIDGVGETHDRIRGIKGGYKRSMESIRILNEIRKKYPINLSINTVIQPDNVMELDEIKNIGNDNDVFTVFSPLIDDTFFASGNVSSSLRFSREQFEKFRDFIRRTYNGASDPSSLFWSRYFSILNGTRRNLPCAFDRYALVLEPTGELRVCTMREWTAIGNIREQSVDESGVVGKSREVRARLKREVCPTCPNYCTTDFALEKEFFTYAMYYFKKSFLKGTKSC